jgi:preprotein translocase subunit SecG
VQKIKRSKEETFMHSFFSHLLTFVSLLTSLFLIVLILIQRGKGGGLAGAFGGMGGQSAFGTKAGDLFTRITIGVAAFWIILLVIMVKVLGGGGGVLSEQMGGAAETKPGVNAPAVPEKQPAGGKAETPAAPAKTPAKSEPKSK